MNKLEIINYIIKECNEKGITAYKIAQATELSSVGIQKIINLETKNPNITTLNAIKKFIDNYNNSQNTVGEPSDKYNNSSTHKDEIIEALNREIDMKNYIIKLLEDKIKHYQNSNDIITKEEEILKTLSKKKE
jgi:transcriptional regulator with XRE-family HTH domain